MFNDPYSVFRTHQLEIHHKLESTNKHEKHSKATKAKEQSLKTTKIPHIHNVHIHAYSYLNSVFNFLSLHLEILIHLILSEI